MSKVFPNKEQKKLLLTLLKVLGGHKVEVSFSGGGDSGSIDGVFLMDANGNQINLDGATMEWHETKSTLNDETKRWSTQTTPVPDMPLADILTQITDNALEESGLDWYNNDGGQGEFTIDLSTDPPTINLSVGVHYTQTDYHDFDYTDNEEEEDAPPSP